MTQLHWLLSDCVEDLKPIIQVQNHTWSQYSDQRCNQQTSCSDRQPEWSTDIILLANVVPISSEGNNDSPKKQHQPLGNSRVLVFVVF